jgi:hypothetical protein
MQNMTELVKKYQDEEQYPRMIGSEGGMDYLILAKNEETGLQLGLKPMFGVGNVQGKQTVLVSFRLRSARIPGTGGQVIAMGDAQSEGEPNSLKDPHEGWDFPWERVGDSHTGPRASLIRTAVLARTQNEAQFVFDDLDHIRFYGKVMDFLHQHIPEEQFAVTDEDITSFLKASYYPQVLGLQASAGDPHKQLEMLELSGATQVTNHEANQEAYEKAKKELLEKIAAAEEGTAPKYHPKAHFGEDELIPMESVVHAVLSGAKPQLSVVGDEEAPATGSFESMDEPDMSAEGHDFDGPAAA